MKAGKLEELSLAREYWLLQSGIYIIEYES